MILRKIAGSCEHAACPGVFLMGESADVVVQGFAITDVEVLEQLDLPEGEVAAIVPWSLLESAMAARVPDYV